MATEAPTPQTLTSWEDAFHHPIPTTRRLETQLRADVAANQEKVRAIVGSVVPRPLPPSRPRNMFTNSKAWSSTTGISHHGG